MINKTCRFLLKIQIFAAVVIYFLFVYRMWTKEYDPRFCGDSLIFNHISLFWFAHLVLAGICLTVIACLLLKKANAKSVIAWEFIIIFSVFLFVGIAEVYFRLRPEALPFQALSDLGFTEKDKAMKDKAEYMFIDKYSEDKELGLIHRPNLSFELKAQEFSYPVRTDKYGFSNHNDETLYENADIVTIGDSFTEGVGAPTEFSYPRQLAQILDTRVLNLGHGTYDCYQFPIVLKRYGIQSRPKIVLMTLWDWNDLQLRYPSWREYCNLNGYIPLQDYYAILQKEIKKPRFFMAAYWKYLKEKARALFAKYMALWNYGDYRGICVKGKWLRFPVSDAIVYGGEFLEKCLKYAEEYAGEIKNLSGEHNFRFIVIYIPSKQLVYNHFMKLPPSHKYKEEMKKTVIARLRKMGIEVIDMAPVLVKSVENGIMPFYPIDDHMNRDGYHLLALTAADYLKDSLELKMTGKN